MTYLALARKYRPQSFNEVLGQEPSIKTLSNAISLNRLHHAYLFCGARGVGKTSIARIFAKSLNCENGPTATPCQTCVHCTGITVGSCMDVFEMDGASNTSVDNIRELREQAKYKPASARYKIFIIDEVHMLSTSAFNALLKILEEPPPHLLFFFATTEVQKIPVTILSRCQRFDFGRIPSEKLLVALKNILEKENVKIADDALALIIQGGEGSVRDTLSILDQVISFGNENISREMVQEILGLADNIILIDCLKAVLSKDLEKISSLMANLYEKGCDMNTFGENLLARLRHLVLLAQNPKHKIELAQDEVDALLNLSQQKKPLDFLMYFQVLLKGLDELKRSSQSHLILEMILFKMVYLDEVVLLAADEKNETVAAPIAASSPQRPAPQTRTPEAPSREFSKPVSSPANTQPSRPALQHTSEPKVSQWFTFVKFIGDQKPQVGSILEQAKPHFASETNIQLGLASPLYIDMLKERLPLITELAKTFFKKEIQFEVTGSVHQQALQSAGELKKIESDKQKQDLKMQVLANPAVQVAQNVLGASIKEIIDLKKE